MTTKQFWLSTSLGAVIGITVVGAVFKTLIPPAPVPAPVPPAPIPSPDPAPPPPTPDAPATAIAPQKAKLKLDDGRMATFRFAVTSGTLSCTAAVGLDQVLAYDLLPLGDPPPPDPLPIPTPPAPNPPAPTPTPPAASNLRVLFIYDPLTLIDMPPEKQAILASPQLRSYLDKHCPLEGGCAAGMCPLRASKTPSYRFLPTGADVSRLSPVWQQTYRSAATNAAPWILATNEAGQTVIDQAWPASAEDTIKLLQKYGGP
ncbi:MAG: hypothetical protein ACLP9L_34365 [Thermoguttaceae bacterium]